MSVCHANDPDPHGPGKPAALPHAHDFLVLTYLESATGTLQIDGQQRQLADGTVLPVAPGSVISADDRNHPHWTGWTVAFTPDAIPALASIPQLAWAQHPLLAVFTHPDTDLVAPQEQRQRWANWCVELRQELDEPQQAGAHEATAAILTQMLVTATRMAGLHTAEPDPLVLRVFAHIEAAFSGPLTSASVAASIGYSPGHLTTLMRERTGRPLKEWITERRMAEARRLLADSELPLDVIAAKTGMGDASYLVRRFRTWHGTTPQRWRENALR